MMHLVYRYISLGGTILIGIAVIIYWNQEEEEQRTIYDKNEWGPDAVFYHPVVGAGIGSLCLLGTSNADKRHSRIKLKREYNVNVCLSDVIPLNRPVPDSSPKGCQDLHYSINDLPKASLIITFHNEWPSLLFRTIHSVIQRTPKQLLRNIILVDDASENDISNEISEYVKKHYSSHMVKIIRQNNRQGLIRSRLHGIKHVTGEVVVFLDSHMEVNSQWLEPLLEEIRKDDHVVAEGNLDYINQETLRYEYSSDYKIRYGFDWRLRVFGTYFRKDQLEGKKETDSVPGVILIGSGFAISLKYFKSIGTYDSGMEIWGGENIELSWRIWLCGGRIIQVACSRIGHIERNQPYVFPEGRKEIELHNYKRAVDVWMGDDYKQFTYKVYPEMQNVESGDIADRLALKNKLQCKPFDWFLDNIWPELFAYNRSVHQYGTVGLRNIQQSMCLDNEYYVLSEPKILEARHCINIDSQIFALTKKAELRTTLHCVTVKNDDKDFVPWLQSCLEIQDKWSLSAVGHLKHEGTGLCLELLRNGLIMNNCNAENQYQLWSFQMTV